MAVLSDDMGGITAYAAAVNRGYTGTKEEFEQLMYSYTEVAERAEAAAGNAHESEEASIEAKDISVSAKNEAVSARDAAVSARDASISAKNNSESARDAAISAKDDTLAAKDAVMSAKGSVDETSANFSDAVTAAISDVNAAGRNQKELAKTHAIDSEAWAVGQREGADVGVNDETYHNNSKYYAEQSALAKSETETARDTAITAKDNAVAAKNEAETAKGQAQDIVDGINAKSEQIDQNAEDISDLQIAISTKAEVDGNYENLTVGTAEQLIGEVVSEDSVPYIIRKSIAGNSNRLYNQIVGGTVCWNQLVRNGNFESASNWDSTRAELAVSDNVAIITANSIDAEHYSEQLFTTIAEHKYCVLAKIKTDGSQWVFRTYYNGTSATKSKQYSGTTWLDVGYVINNTVSAINNRVRIVTDIENSVVNVTNVCIFDLTKMFGSTIADYIYNLEQTTAGAGVAFFKALFPNNYYEYNSGELVSVSGLSEHKTVGFNQWDEEYVLGSTINPDTGAESVDGGNIRSKNYIPVIPNTAYYIKVDTPVIVVGYDANKEYVGYIKYGDGNSVFTTKKNNVDKIIHYIRFGTYGNNYGVTYKNDICINLSDPAKNGTYEPYESHSYPLDSTLTLRGLFKLDANNNLYADGDTYDADGTVARKYGIVDLGTLTWTTSGSGTNLSTGISTLVKIPSSNGVMANLVCEKYVISAASPITGNDGKIGIDTTGRIQCGADGTPSGYLVYELATPTTEQAQPFTNPQIVDDFGTEEYVTDSIVPVGHVTKYANNLRAKLEMAPNSPDGDGDYIVRQTNGLNEYVSLSSSEVIQNINEAISDNADDISELKEDLTAKVDVDGYHQITPENIYGVQITGNLFDDAELSATNKYVNVSNGKLVYTALNNFNSYIINAYPVKYSFTFARFVLMLEDDKETAIGSLIQNTELIDNTDGHAKYIAFSFNVQSYPVSSYVVSIGETLDPSDKAYELPDWMIYRDTKPKSSRISGNMVDGGSLIISDSTAVQTTTNLRKGERIAYYADITSFSRVEVGLSYNKSLGNARINRVVVDDTNVSVYTIGTAGPPTVTAHGLTIANNIQILLEVLATRQMKLTIISNGESFSQTYAWSRDAYGMPYALSDGSVLTGCELSWTCKDIDKDIWIFGDSYLQYDPVRWTYYLHEFGYDENALLDGYAGQASGAGNTAFKSLLNYGTPKYAIWILGMNDGTDTDDSTPNSSWIANRDSFLTRCSNNNVTPVFGTIPTVPSINNNGKNAWIRSSGYRYVDFAKAVGADGTGAWYSGMLSSDNVHPTEKGAKALCMQCLTDFPEIMVDN